MIHIDVKKVGRIPDGGGWRVHGRGSSQAKAVDRTKTRGTRAGYVYLHSAIDGFSRLAYTEALPDEKAITAIAFLDRARTWFAGHGIVQIERIVTDNGSCYRAAAFTASVGGSRHQRITPYTPRHNGKVERYNRILAEEFLYARTWTSEQERADALGAWNLHYNYHRPNGAHDWQPPASRRPLRVNNVLASYRLGRVENGATATTRSTMSDPRRPRSPPASRETQRMQDLAGHARAGHRARPRWGWIAGSGPRQRRNARLHGGRPHQEFRLAPAVSAGFRCTGTVAGSGRGPGRPRW
jgi:hypothetical protein